MQRPELRPVDKWIFNCFIVLNKLVNKLMTAKLVLLLCIQKISGGTGWGRSVNSDQEFSFTPPPSKHHTANIIRFFLLCKNIRSLSLIASLFWLPVTAKFLLFPRCFYPPTAFERLWEIAGRSRGFPGGRRVWEICGRPSPEICSIHAACREQRSKYNQFGQLYCS